MSYYSDPTRTNKSTYTAPDDVKCTYCHKSLKSASRDCIALEHPNKIRTRFLASRVA